MNILFIGDIVGEPGRLAVQQLLPDLRRELALDFVIANGENAAGGNGITPAIASELFAFGVDVLTSGDHLWDQKEVIHLLEKERRFLRPMNYPDGTPGFGLGLYPVPDAVSRFGRETHVGVLNVQGRTFMQPALNDPFSAAQAGVRQLLQQTRVVFVDFHAEASSEKMAMGRHLDGQASAVVGTHTHVQTADEQIFQGGTAFLTDAGFTGPHESVLGRKIQPVIQRFLTAMPQRFEVAREGVKLLGVCVSVDVQSGHATAIQRISKAL